MIKCPMLNAEVCDAINEELDYQNSLIDTPRAGGQDYRVAGQVLTLTEYVDRARSAWVNNGDEEGDRLALDNLRKCAAICCRALLLYGCPRRDFTPRPC